MGISFLLANNLNIFKTGDDTKTLRIVEALIEADFRNGLPPHLQPSAKSMTYDPGSDQSRIYVASNSEFSGLHARDIQRILHQRLILVHGIPFDYSYGWDLESFARLYDVDKKISVQGKMGFPFAKPLGLKLSLVSTLVHPYRPELRHHQGTLRELHKMTSQLNEDCPPSTPSLYQLTEGTYISLLSLGVWHHTK